MLLLLLLLSHTQTNGYSVIKEVRERERDEPRASQQHHARCSNYSEREGILGVEI